MKICAITVIKDEREYLKEWIDYHKEIFDKLFIIEDRGSVSHKDLIDTDKVELIPVAELFKDNIDEFNNFIRWRIFTQKVIQREAVRQLINSGEYDWGIVMDIDEFVTFDGDLNEILSEFNDYYEVLVYWKNYGANGHITKPDYSKKSFREYYTKECCFSNVDFCKNVITKKFIHLKTLPSKYVFRSHHHPNNLRFTKTDFTKTDKTPCYDKVYLKHYITKSFEEYYYKLFIRGMCYKYHRTLDDFFEMNPDMIPLKDMMIKQMDEKYKRGH